MNKIPFIEKYRPTDPNLIIYHENIKNSLEKYMENGIIPNLLMIGGAGVGKTTMITTFAKKYYGENYDNMTLMINASENRGIDIIRGIINDFSMTSSISLFENTSKIKYKLVILDEIDSMTSEAQEILRQVIEYYNNNVRFCLICNFIKKINISLQSRCILFKFKSIPFNELNKYISKICFLENIEMSSKSITVIINYCNGDLRKLLNILQSLKMNCVLTGENKIVIKNNDINKILLCPSIKEVEKLLFYIKDNTLIDTIKYFKNNMDYALNEIVLIMFDYLMKLLTDNDEKIFTNEKLFNIIKDICIINERLCYINKDDLQIYSFLSIFYK